MLPLVSEVDVSALVMFVIVQGRENGDAVGEIVGIGVGEALDGATVCGVYDKGVGDGYAELDGDVDGDWVTVGLGV